MQTIYFFQKEITMNKEIFIIYKIPSVPTEAYENWNDSPYAIKYLSEHTSLKEAKTVLKNNKKCYPKEYNWEYFLRIESSINPSWSLVLEDDNKFYDGGI